MWGHALQAPTTFEEVVLVYLFKHNSKFYPYSHVACIVMANFLMLKKKNKDCLPPGTFGTLKQQNMSYLSEVQINQASSLCFSKCALHWNPIRYDLEEIDKKSIQIIFTVFQVRGHFCHPMYFTSIPSGSNYCNLYKFRVPFSRDAS